MLIPAVHTKSFLEMLSTCLNFDNPFQRTATR